MKSILIKNSEIVNYDKTFVSDLLIENGKISKIDKKISEKADIIIDAKGKYLFPGGIDTHVHFDLPTPAGNTADNFFTGSKAALSGGTTSVIDFVTPNRNEDFIIALENRIKEAENCLCNVKFHFSPTWWNDKSPEIIAEISKNYNINSFKIYMAYKNAVGIEDDTIVKIMNSLTQIDGILTVHAENDEIIDYLKKDFVSKGKVHPKYHALSRPDDAEADAISRIILYAKYTNCTVYIVHVSSAKGIKLIEKAQKEGIKIFAETCPHYLILNDSVYEKDFEKSVKYVLSPPIRKIKDNQALWEAISSGVIQTIGTDHCSFNIKNQKEIGKNDFSKVPNGAGGVEHRLELLYTFGVLENKISLNKFVEICSYNPAKIFNFNNKGEIKEGFDADLVIWEPNFEKTISAKTHIQNCDNNIYEGIEVKGKADTTILGGKIIEI